MGHGMASTMAPMTAAVMVRGGAQRAGLGSATANSSREVGGVFVALLGTILFTRLEKRAGAEPRGSRTLAPAAVQSSRRRTRQLDVGALGLDPNQAAAVGRAFGDAFLSGSAGPGRGGTRVAGGRGSSRTVSSPAGTGGAGTSPARCRWPSSLAESELLPRLAASSMELALRIVSVAVGLVLVYAAIASAVKTVVIPRLAARPSRGLLRAPAPLPPGDARIDALRASGACSRPTPRSACSPCWSLGSA